MAGDDTPHEPGAAKEIVGSLRDRSRRHRAPLFAAAIAFYAFLALIPTLTGVIGVYGLIADPDQVTDQLTDLLDGAPEETRAFLVSQMRTIASGSGGALGASVVISIVIALFSASGAMANLIKSLNVAYDLTESRKLWVLRGLALSLMFGAVAVLVVVLFLMAALPPVLADVGLGRWARLVLNVARYPILGAVMAGALSMLYRLGPDHAGNDRPLSPRLFTTGGLVATVLFVVLSGLFGYYATNFGSYGETYGPLATIIVLLIWFQLSALSVIVGAEVDAELADRAWRERTGLEDPAARAGDPVSASARMMEAMAAHDVAGVLATWHRRGQENHPLFGELAVPDQLGVELATLFGAFPDLAIDVQNLTGAGDSATARYRMRGTFDGDSWHRVEPNGKSIDIDVVSILRVEDGYVVRNEVLFDTAALTDQLGFRPGDVSRGARLRIGVTNATTRIRRRVRADRRSDSSDDDEETVTAA